MHAERRAVAHAQRRAGNAQRKNRALVRVHAARRAAHGVLRQKPRHAQRVKARLRVFSPVRKADARTGFKIRPERARAVDECEDVHIPVRARVVPVHQPRLGRHRHLEEQRALGVFRRPLRKRRFKVRVDDCVRLFKQRVRAVRAASRADRRRVAAEQTAPRGQADLRPRDLAAVRRDHVDIQQPPQRLAVLQRAEPPLDCPRVRANAEHRLRPRLFVDGRVKQRFAGREHRLHVPQAPRKRALDVLRPPPTRRDPAPTAPAAPARAPPLRPSYRIPSPVRPLLYPPFCAFARILTFILSELCPPRKPPAFLYPFSAFHGIIRLLS